MDGWRGSVARFLVGVLPFTGLRPKEVRLARIQDVDLARRRILVALPKGEGKWAAADFAPIGEPALPAFEDFLAEREKYLDGEACEFLIPLRKTNLGLATGASSEDWLRHLKQELQTRSGVEFRGLKTMRATFAQDAVDRGVPNRGGQ